MNKLALGTVQFGLNYGIVNQDGQVSTEEVRNILNYARNRGIEVLDTASNYGTSEEILGLVGVDDFQIITKTVSFKAGAEEVVNGFNQSLKKLNQTAVYGLLIHNIEEVKDRQFDFIFRELLELKQQGLINKIGFSTYTPEQVDFLLKNFDFDLIQVPFNVFDVRLLHGGQLQRLKDVGVEVHARSVFLQGVLLNLNNLPDYFLTWKKQFNEYQEILKKENKSLLEYALNFVLSIQEIDKVLIGIDGELQLREILQVVDSKDGGRAYPVNDINLLNPSLWKV